MPLCSQYAVKNALKGKDSPAKRFKIRLLRGSTGSIIGQVLCRDPFRSATQASRIATMTDSSEKHTRKQTDPRNLIHSSFNVHFTPDLIRKIRGGPLSSKGFWSIRSRIYGFSHDLPAIGRGVRAGENLPLPARDLPQCCRSPLRRLFFLPLWALWATTRSSKFREPDSTT